MRRPDTLVLAVALVAAALLPWLAMEYLSLRAERALQECRANLRDLGTAMEMYSMDNSGRYPKALTGLWPDYLGSLPTCPAAGEDTYSASFQALT